MTDEQGKTGVNIGYALGQLWRALSSRGETAEKRANDWRSVLAGMIDGSLQIGSRTPVRDTPPWVTLGVAHGGFATGSFAAGGDLQPHEVAKLGTVGRGSAVSERAALNAYYLSDEGRSDLCRLLESGCYRVMVPEEAALLANAWLLRQGQPEAAEQLLAALIPFFDRLRFYPVPNPTASRLSGDVSLETAGEVRARLARRKAQVDVLRMNEAILIWAPLYDRTVALFLETVDGDLPHLAPSGSAAQVVQGGWPCRRAPADFSSRANAILEEYAKLRNHHRLCTKPEKPKENFARLRRLLAVAASDPTNLDPRDVAEARRVLACYLSAYGAPGSATHVALRESQRREAERPLHHVVAAILAERLASWAQDEGVPDLGSLIGPLSSEEARKAQCTDGAAVPVELAARAKRCLEAPLDCLVNEGVVTSTESMARLLPPITASTRTVSIEDAELRRLYSSVYSAFRKRRSLLLLNLESQTKFGELPWVAGLKPWTGGDAAAATAAGQVLKDAGVLAISAFPHTILPNKLVKELRALSITAGTRLPLVEELAADIFMGAFSEQYLRAAQLAAGLLQGSLYERYYGLDYAAILRLNDVTKQQYGAAVSPGFAAICQSLAGEGDKVGGSVAANGTVIEQAQILTTHNLAALFAGAGVDEILRPRLPELAQQCFRWICRRQQITRTAWQVRLRMQKNTAYAWRQLIFYLSLCSEAEVEEFIGWSEAHLATQVGDFAERFRPVLNGLQIATRGERFEAHGVHASGARRFLGWSIGRHWLMPREP